MLIHAAIVVPVTTVIALALITLVSVIDDCRCHRARNNRGDGDDDRILSVISYISRGWCPVRGVSSGLWIICWGVSRSRSPISLITEHEAVSKEKGHVKVTY